MTALLARFSRITRDQRKYKESSKIRIRTNVKAGGIASNHNQIVTSSLKVKSGVKASGMLNHNQTVTRRLRVKTNVKAGLNYTKIVFNY
jgi:hypothetical protein